MLKKVFKVLQYLVSLESAYAKAYNSHRKRLSKLDYACNIIRKQKQSGLFEAIILFKIRKSIFVKYLGCSSV